MTRKEDIWHCSECGAEKGRYDMWFVGDICEACIALTLDDEEKALVNKFCEDLRRFIKADRWLNRISGGFCVVSFKDCNEQEINLDVKFGVQNDCGSDITEGWYIIDRLECISGEPLEIDWNNFVENKPSRKSKGNIYNFTVVVDKEDNSALIQAFGREEKVDFTYEEFADEWNSFEIYGHVYDIHFLEEEEGELEVSIYDVINGELQTHYWHNVKLIIK